ncbi:hypothetical protein [Methylobacterium frigidaeris]|uniref:Uncharacterized protein n=1 Tax=Methylobacterium frigidaeris TaxID=2038277 RepID=A0AA37HD81_9HYPH|nr:hypothetical protein [Methylobacterium frigidaeris]GJD63644.1 hypothetical protein MPEAHAMD_3814 [Methylobacterium frigidaeris]
MAQMVSKGLIEMDADQYYIVTYFGSFIGFDVSTKQLKQFRYTGAESLLENNAATLYGAKFPAIYGRGGHRVDGSKILDVELVGDPADGVVGLRSSRGFLGAAAENDIFDDKQELGSWEKFRLVSRRELDDLHVIATCKWISKPSGDYYEDCRLSFGREFVVNLGNLSLSFDKPFRVFRDPANPDGMPREFIAFYDDWKIGRFIRYNPLVYLVAYGAERIFKMLQISLNSLAEFGKYGGDIAVITDKTKEEVAPYIPRAFDGRWYVVHEPAHDFVGFCKARYQISRWEYASSYQPILYTDTDVIFDSPTDPILAKLLLAGKFAAQREGTRPLATSDSVGASLLSEDKCVVGDRKGFNSGIICIPNASDFNEAMLAISECIDRYARARGRQSLGWFDQAIANYVTFKLCEVDVDILDLHTRWGGRDALHGGVYPRGFVHLWGGKDKVSQMQELTESLKGASRQGVAGWTYF